MPVHSASRNAWVFLLPSLLGIFLFMTPVPFEGNVTIPIAIMAKSLLAHLGDHAVPLITGLVVLSALLTILTKLLRPAFVMKSPVLQGLFNPSWLWSLTRIAGALAMVLTFTQVGPAIIHSENTGGLVLNDLLPTLLCVFLFAGLLLPLLINFGLLELIGALLTRLMRPLFNLPGRAAVTSFASWLGDGSVGVLMTSKQYEQNLFTEREAAVIGTTFTAVSVTFSLVVISTVGLEAYFLPFYGTVCLAGLVAAIIVPRLPPLSRKADRFADGRLREGDDEVVPAGQSSVGYGYRMALARADQIKGAKGVVKEGVINAADMILGVLPVVMAIGTLALIIAETTPLFQWLGAPFVPLLELLQIPDAHQASTTVVVGFADMFLPAIMAASIDSELTRFVIAALSVSQLIFMSETGALMLGSKVPVTLWELFLIFILRTLVVLPVIALMGHWLF
ncbi:YjiH family protein [Ferrimonas gelatinilytica]|uniref:YjiH family protein n=1 Tax=Ferrimonas gelatinilytica TaxID=1255257 RepID=A0ABP9RUQ1_9GAMM